MALSVTTEERLAAAVAYLREAGHEEEAQAVETLAARSGQRPGSSPSPDAEPVSIADAAEELGETPDRIRQRIELGMLTGVGDGEAGYQFVTRGSLDELLANQRGLAIIADFPYTVDDEEGGASNSTLLAQILAAAESRDDRSRSLGAPVRLPNRAVPHPHPADMT